MVLCSTQAGKNVLYGGNKFLTAGNDLEIAEILFPFKLSRFTPHKIPIYSAEVHVSHANCNVCCSCWQLMHCVEGNLIGQFILYRKLRLLGSTLAAAALKVQYRISTVAIQTSTQLANLSFTTGNYENVIFSTTAINFSF